MQGAAGYTRTEAYYDCKGNAVLNLRCISSASKALGIDIKVAKSASSYFSLCFVIISLTE